MAESCSKAFGRYLKTLRERRGLSLDDVRSLSQTFPDKIRKAYLSRCENGHQRLAFSKLIPLSRIYEVPSDVLVERMELDMELERIGGPDTEGLNFEELRLAGKNAMASGHRWDSYGYLRDAVVRAAIDPVLTRFRDVDEQIMVAFMNCASSAHGLGRTKFCFFECEHLRGLNKLSINYVPLLWERLAVCHRALDRSRLARQAIDMSVDAAERSQSSFALGVAYSSRARLAWGSGDCKAAVDDYQRAYRFYKNIGEREECARTMINLAQIFFDQGRFFSARRALQASDGLTNLATPNRGAALAKILLGEIETKQQRHETASRLWVEAVEIGKQLDDKTLVFKAEFLLFKQAKETGNPSATVISRRLHRLAPGIPRDTPELREFLRGVGSSLFP